MHTIDIALIQKEMDQYLDSGKSGEAIRRMSAIATEHENNASVFEVLGNVLIRVYLLEDAAKCYYKAFWLDKTIVRNFWKYMTVLITMNEQEKINSAMVEAKNVVKRGDDYDLFCAIQSYMKGYYRECIAVLEKPDLQELDFPSFFYWKSEALQQLLRIEEWDIFVNKYALRDKTNPYCRIVAAGHSARSGYPVVAEELITQLLIDFPHFAPAYLQIAILCWEREDLPAAEHWFEKAIQKAPWSDEIIGMVAVFNATEFPTRLNWDELVAQSKDTGKPKLAYYLGKIAMSVKKDIPAAIYFFDQTVSSLPDFVDARRLLGTACLQANDHKKALAVFEAANDITPGLPDILNGIAFASLQLDDHKKAKQYYQLLLQGDDTHTEAMHALSLLAYEEKDFVTAMDHIRRAIKTESKEPRHFFMAAQIEAAAGNKQQAIRCINDALKYDPANEKYQSFKRSLE